MQPQDTINENAATILADYVTLAELAETNPVLMRIVYRVRARLVSEQAGSRVAPMWGGHKASIAR